ncbi:MAG: 50S ribosomal protein L23 [Clostridiaceae bacterium]|jgi:large subunit ribosomal protein L23|nr:50S ribosomal protein L23 [Bacillota bacterium]NLN51776.1 50S ribosomal protein L23 [Clostridiaceae bacterium]
MRSPYDIIIKPVITERSTMDSMEGKYTFAVDKRATKTEVRQAVEKLFDVRVVKVNTQNISGKMKRVNMHTGKTADWKKAIVTIDLDPQESTYFAEGGQEKKTSRKYKTSIEEFGFGL